MYNAKKRFRKVVKRSSWLALSLVSIISLLSACNLPARRTPTASGVDLIYTAAAQTVEAQTSLPAPTSSVESTFPGATATQPDLPTTLAPPPTLPPTSTPPLATATPLPCDRVKFISDVTIPDNTELQPNQVFVKTWRLQNIGSCTWNSAYTLVVDGENIFNAPQASPITAGVVPPNSTIDVSVSLTAPSLAGTHRGNFKLANPGNQHFALGSDGSKPFWAQIKVVVPTGIVFDFLTRASQAEWKTGKLNNLHTTLTFGGDDLDINGVAKIKDGVKLENGAISGKILLTVPIHQDDGVIAGIFPAFLVQTGDRLRARVGFITNPDGNCGLGKVIFQVNYLLNGVSHILGEWPEVCDGNLTAINVDLSSLKGKNIQVVLLVKTAGTVLDEWAIWNSPRIER